MTLTEQWKKGELKDGFYYFRMPDGTTDVASEYRLMKYILTRDADKISLLAKVPNYKEYNRLKEVERKKGKLVNVNYKIKQENQQLRKWCEEFNALDVAKENQQLKDKLEKAEATLLDIEGSWVTDEIRSKVSEYFVYAIGEKK